MPQVSLNLSAASAAIGQRRSAAEHVERVPALERAEQRRPVDGDGLRKHIRQSRQRGQQRVIAHPMAEDAEARDDGADKALGRGNGLLDACTKIDRDIRRSRKRRVRRVGERQRDRTIAPRRLRHGDDVRALAGLRNRNRGATFELQFAAVDRHDRWTDRGDRHAGHQLDGIFEKGRSVVRGAARDRCDHHWLLFPERRARLGEAVGRLRQQASSGIGDLLDLDAHVGCVGRHQWLGLRASPSRSSATKS